MKKLMNKVAFLLLTVLLSTQVIAQPGRGKERNPEERAKRHMTMMFGSIDGLSDEQKADIEALYKKYQPEMKALKDEAKAKFQENKATMKPKIDALQAKVAADMSKVLSQEQMEQYNVFQQDMRKRRMGKKGAGGKRQRRTAPPAEE